MPVPGLFADRWDIHLYENVYDVAFDIVDNATIAGSPVIVFLCFDLIGVLPFLLYP